MKKGNKFYSLWLSLVLIIIFILQNIIPGFTEMFILNQLSYQQIWRFVTSILLHNSLIHLTYNLFALIFFGLILEKIIGSNKYLAVFFISGLTANLVSINFYNASLGASGAIFGIIGCLTILKPLIPVLAFNMILPMVFAAILWMIGDILGFIFAYDNIGHLAHLSGLIIGIIFGAIFRLKKRKKKNNEQNKIRYTRNIGKIS